MDKDTFTLVVKEYRKMVRAAIIKVIPSLNYGMDLDDLEQETWAKVWEQREQYDPAKSQIQTWLHRVATSVAIDHLRAESAQKRPTLVLRDTVLAPGIEGMTEIPYYEDPPSPESHGSDAMPPCSPSAEETAVADERVTDIAKKLDELGRREREILHLAYEEDLSAREIAATLGLKYDNVRQIMARSRQFVTGR
jgi:RNA polymerase sigma-70 factor (ECF subfamily)